MLPAVFLCALVVLSPNPNLNSWGAVALTPPPSPIPISPASKQGGGSGEIVRGPFGVPHIFANTVEGAFFRAGYVVAQDRLWQMDLSRRSAKGRLSELIGRNAVAGDLDALRFGYTEEEYAELFAKLAPKTQTILSSYSDGINAWMTEAAETGRLPAAYGDERPMPWTVSDSLAIVVNLARRFGTGGAGEIRNLLLYTYLRARLGDDTLKAIEDIAWIDDPSSIPTISDEDDPHEGRSSFPPHDPTVLAKHVQLLPRVNLLELMPGIRLQEQSDMLDLAAELGLPYRFGSYAMVVSPERSAIGVPVLLGAPQMGFSVPSRVHQMSISCPEYTAVGMNLPGVPGMLIGHSQNASWTVTSGVADTDDVFFVELNPDDPTQYRHNGSWVDFEVVETSIPVRGEQPAMGRREMSVHGPVVIKSPSTGVAYVRKSSVWMRESDSLDEVISFASARTMQDFRQIALRIVASFNLFVATTEGDIGFFYCGRVPVRSVNADPRLPAPASPEYDWTGVVPADRMPYSVNPKQGFFANWNNKPVSWWPNHDTPVWGRIFRNEILVAAMAAPEKLSGQHFESFARLIATSGMEQQYFLPGLLLAAEGPGEAGQFGSDEFASPGLNEVEQRAFSYLKHWDGNRLDGSVAPVLYESWIIALREEIFSEKLGNLLAPANFQLAVQPTMIWNALNAKTNIDYLNGRSRSEVKLQAFRKAVAGLQKRVGTDVATWTFPAPRIQLTGLPSVLYSDRGSYIQVVELWDEPRGRYVIPPGVSEDPGSPHYSDQQELAANWAFLPMLWKRSDLRQ